MNIAILYGGKTGEHEVSMVSASSVARNIDSTKHNINLISISKEGLWYLQPASELEKVQKDTKAILSDGNYYMYHGSRGAADSVISQILAETNLVGNSIEYLE